MAMFVRLLAITAIVFAVGCGKESPRQSLYGKISLDGEPVETGKITFTPAAGTTGPVVGAEIEDGEYELESGKGPVPGDYQVAISSTEKGEPVVVIPGEEPGFTSVEKIPAQYNKETTLTVTIKEGSNEQDFQLNSSGG